MPFDKSDPRAGLAGSGSPELKSADAYAGTEYGKFYEMAPSEKTAVQQTWFFRGQNMIIAYTEASAGAVFTREDQMDEYVLLLPDRDASADITTGSDTARVAGFTISILPPGASRIQTAAACRFVRLFTVRSEDLAAKCANEASYGTPHPNVSLFEPWPEPPGGYRLRTYSLDVAPQEGRFGRIWRCTTFMVNYLDVAHGPRDVTKLSPHSHPDFEQCSLVLAGEFIHHIRWPWTTNLNNWRDDEHVHCGLPSVAVIPPPAIHTTRAVGEGENQLVDIFCPPRVDFSQKPGWVLNSDEYPMPNPV